MSAVLSRPALAFTGEDAEALYANGWKFNCGPGALAAITGETPMAVMNALPQFRQRGYTNPKMMRRGLEFFGRHWHEKLSEEEAAKLPQLENLPDYGLVRVQFDGPWTTNPGVPIRARYRHTHWVAVDGREIFDINNIWFGGWMAIEEWAYQLIPWLIRECEPKSANGDWWGTHCWEVER